MGQDLEILPTLKGTIPEPVANRSLPLRSAYPEAGRVPANYPMAMLAPAKGPGHQPLMLAGSRGLFHHHPINAGGPTPSRLSSVRGACWDIYPGDLCMPDWAFIGLSGQTGKRFTQ